MSEDDYISLQSYTHETPADVTVLSMSTLSSSSTRNNKKRQKQRWKPKATANGLSASTLVTALSTSHQTAVIDVEQVVMTSAMDVTEPIPQPSITPPQPPTSTVNNQLLPQSPALSTFNVTSANTVREDDGAYRIVMNANERIVFIGSIDVVVLRGAVSVYGARLTPNNANTTTTSSSSSLSPTVYHIHSPHYCPSSLLSLQSSTDDTCVRLSRCTLPVAIIIDDIDNGTETLPITIVGFAALVRQSAISRSKIAYDMMNMLPSWSNAIDTITQPLDRAPRILVCGARGSGKSTLNRLTVNSLLSASSNSNGTQHRRHLHNNNAVAYIDVDLGQSELNVYGQISLHIITKPLLGPPHTHQQPPVVSYYMGDNTSGHEPARYISGIRQIYRVYQRGQYKHLPLVVNTQGWLSGLGLSLLQQTIRIVKPNYVWQLTDLSSAPPAPAAVEQSASVSESLDITSDIVSDDGSDMKDDTSNTTAQPTSNRRIQAMNDDETNVMNGIPSNIRCQHILLQRYISSKDTSSRTRISADQLRTLSLITYFATPAYYNKRFFQINLLPISLSIAAISLYHQIPYKVSISSMILCLLQQDIHPDLLLASFNTAIVGLCHIDNDDVNNADIEHYKMPEFINNNNNNSELIIHYRRSRTIRAPLRCYGVGIIHSIDLQNALFHIFTPTPAAELLHVNALCRSNVALPNVFFATPTTNAATTNSNNGGDVSESVSTVGVSVLPDAYVSSGMSGAEILGANTIKSRNTIGRNRLKGTQMTE